MSQLKVDNITDEEGTGAPNFSNGLTGVVPASSIAGALNASGDAPLFAARAWVNFNSVGTVAIRASGNVSSITDNGTGDYTVNFTTPLTDANYCAVFGATANSGNRGGKIQGENSTDRLRTVSALRVRSSVLSTGSTDSAPSDTNNFCVAIFR